MSVKKICLNCMHWGGDREAQNEMIKERGEVCMDREKGWPEEGTCYQATDFCEMNIYGDAVGNLLFKSNFGCIYWEEHDGTKCVLVPVGIMQRFEAAVARAERHAPSNWRPS